MVKQVGTQRGNTLKKRKYPMRASLRHVYGQPVTKLLTGSDVTCGVIDISWGEADGQTHQRTFTHLGSAIAYARRLIRQGVVLANRVELQASYTASYTHIAGDVETVRETTFKGNAVDVLLHQFHPWLDTNVNARFGASAGTCEYTPTPCRRLTLTQLFRNHAYDEY